MADVPPINEGRALDEPAPRLFRAILDGNLVYQGFEQVQALDPTDVPVPENCDLKAGKYAWNPTGKTFVAIFATAAPDPTVAVPPSTQALIVVALNKIEAALDTLMKAQGGFAYPKDVAAWIKLIKQLDKSGAFG